MADIVQLGLSLDASKVLSARDKANRALSSIARSSKRTETQMVGLSKSFGRLVRAFGTVVAFGLVRGAFREMAEAMKEGEQSGAKLNSVLKATGFSAGRTARQIDELGQAMADTTLFNDDEIRNTAAILATFRNVQGQVFDEALAAMLDMSQVLGQDLKSSAVQLGKALNDPILGISALSRVGVSFTQSQKDMIRTMAEAGDMAGAQGVILRELRNEFGGAAAGAQVGVFASINETRKAWIDFLEVLGRSDFSQTVIGGFFDSLSGFLRSITPTVDDLDIVTIELDKLNTELEKLEGRRIRRQATVDRISELQAEADNLNAVRNSIISQRKAEEDAAKQAAEDAKAAADRERALAVERDTRLKAAQKQADEFNAKQKATAQAWQRSWGRAIENTQDSFADFFKSLATDGVKSFGDFAKQILDIWLDLAAQIAATKLFQAFLSTAVGQGLNAPGIPNVKAAEDFLPGAVGATPPGDLGMAQSGAPPVVVNFNVAAMDAASFAGFAEANKGTFARVIGEAFRDSSSLRRAARGR